MGNLSEIVERVEIPMAIPVPDYLGDHHVGGFTVLPAVEALQIVAQSKPKAWNADVRLQERAVFRHLLSIDPRAGEIRVLQEHLRYADGCCLSRLTTRRSGQQMRFTRRMEHASVFFTPDKRTDAGFSEMRMPDAPDAGVHEGPVFTVPSERLYSELVPFGPAYRNVVDRVCLAEGIIRAIVSGGDFTDATGPLGSPFPLDAAMHAACAWGQRYRNRVVFPIGFEHRRILAPTRAGDLYTCIVRPRPDGDEVLRFDVRLYDRGGRPVEVVLGLAMRDIFGGKWTPPDWVREGI